MNGLINMIFRMFVRRAVNTGMRKGVQMMGSDAEPGSPEELKARRRARKQTKQARQAMRMARRVGRM